MGLLLAWRILWYKKLLTKICRSTATQIHLQNLVHEANEANEREREMKLLTAFRVYPKATMEYHAFIDLDYGRI